MPRLFVGISLSSDIKRALHKTAHEMKLPGRLVPERNMHLTIKFLGNCSDDVAEQTVEILSHVASGHKPQEIEVAGFGAFPSLARPRVAWIGIRRGADFLTHLAQETDYRLKYLFETSKFKPHITIARYKKPEDLKEIAKQHTEVEAGKMLVDKLTLFQSKLSSTGAEYSAYKEFLF